MQWTADAVEDLKKLALEGRSASFIAAMLGVTSRNAVIGKANRVGIKLTGGGSCSAHSVAGRARRAEWAAVPGFLASARKGAPLWFIRQTRLRGRMARPKLERCSESVSKRSANSPVAGPSEIPGAGSSPFVG